MPERPNPLLGAHRFLRRGPVNAEGWSQLVAKDRAWERSYRGRWAHDKVVRSTHGVNCTGSCSWNVYVKEGLITWESQAVDYPSTGPEMPDYEPRGCPRGASFSWYTYSPLRVKYPYVRGSLLEMFREARARLGDPVDAWAEIVEDPEKARLYKRQRGKGGFVRASWDEAVEMIAAAHVHTIKRYGPDRVVGFSPIPAMSQASYAAGTRFLSLIGGVILSFYDWYADLPPSSPQVFGDQTDVPESADWFNAGYLLIWGTNLPTTRTPDAHFMTEARYRGQKVVVVSPDYAEHTKFADHWLAAQPGSDGALAMAMGHVILKEFYVDRQVPYFQDYARRFTDLPLLLTLRERDGAYVPDRLLRASDLEGSGGESEHAEWKPVVLDARTGGLLVIGEPEELAFLYSGGIKVDIDYSPALLYQLAKMDGAITLNANATKIPMANVQLMPDPTILSVETGTRHRTAERVAKQTDALVIAISQRREVISLYVGSVKYILEDIPVVLAKANQALATLDKYRARLDQVSTRLTALEFEGGGTLHDVLTVLQRGEMTTRMAVEIERHIVELGSEGRLIEMHLEETMLGTAAEKAALVHDYIAGEGDEQLAAVLESIGRLGHQDLLDFGRLAELLGYDRKLNTLDYPVAPRGYRILGRIPRLPKLIVANIVRTFGGLDDLLAASDPELEAVDGVGEIRAKDIREGLRRLQEINLVDRYLQT